MTLKIGLCVSVYVSLMCRFSVYKLYMWYHSHVFIIGHFLSMCRMSIVSSIVTYACCVSRMCCAYVEFGLFDLIA
jgi:hypothetical protein